MINLLSVIVSLLIIPCLTSPGLAAPTVTVTPTTKCIEKGGVFQIRVGVNTTENLKRVVIAPLLPNGFYAEPLPSPALRVAAMETTSDKNNKRLKWIEIDELSAGSAITTSFIIWPPDIFGQPREGKKEGFYDIREPQSFAFNVLYNISKDGREVQGSVTISTDVRYTTAMSIYLFWGLIGVVIGYSIKMGTKNRDNITIIIGDETSFLNKSKRVGSYLVVTNLPAFLTIMIIGFGALLALARQAIPITDWHQSIALGIGLALLTDEQLLAKFKM